MNKKIQPRGFTIIEVLIVLAVAGLIMLIVFLAVPTLQKNNRNTTRKKMVGMVASQLEEYRAQRGDYPKNNGEGSAFQAAYLDGSVTPSYQFNVRAGNASNNFAGSIDQITMHYSRWCNKYGDGSPGDAVAGSDPDKKLYAVFTRVEGTGTQFYCVDNSGRS